MTNEFSKKLGNHATAVSLYVAHYNFCREHEALRSTPAVALGITDHVWSIGELIDTALATQPITPGNDSAGSAETVSSNRRRSGLTVMAVS